MSDARRTRIDTEISNRGLSLTAAQSRHDLEELIHLIRAAGGSIARAADASNDTWVIAPIASQTNTITIKSVPAGHSIATGVTTVEIADNGSDALSVTYTAGAVKINLASSTNASNTLTLIKAALDALNTSTNGAVLSCYITGTASTQMTAGGTNTLAATAAGGTAGTGLKSSTAGTSGGFTVTPS